jgi:hypothetical protein
VGNLSPVRTAFGRGKSTKAEVSGSRGRGALDLPPVEERRGATGGSSSFIGSVPALFFLRAPGVEFCSEAPRFDWCASGADSYPFSALLPPFFTCADDGRSPPDFTPAHERQSPDESSAALLWLR